MFMPFYFMNTSIKIPFNSWFKIRELMFWKYCYLKDKFLPIDTIVAYKLSKITYEIRYFFCKLTIVNTLVYIIIIANINITQLALLA